MEIHIPPKKNKLGGGKNRASILKKGRSVRIELAVYIFQVFVGLDQRPNIIFRDKQNQKSIPNSAKMCFWIKRTKAALNLTSP